MKTLSTHVAWYGRDEPPPQVVKLKAGPLALDFQEGELRTISHGGTEYIRRLHVAVRDRNWLTIPAQISSLSVDAAADHFQISFDAFHEDGALRFRWRALIQGHADGRIEYQMRGAAESDFRYCRIGFCVLHPIEGIAGQPYRGQTPDGEISGVLPTLIAPQEMENGFEKPIFPSCSSLTVTAAGGAQIFTEFEGDLFEMEDQRNWTDGSYKTYCTPLALGYPHNARRGQEFFQRVTVRIDLPRGALKAAQEADTEAIHLHIQATEQRLPMLGFGMPSDNHATSPRQIALLRRLQPDHLKVETHLREEDWQEKLAKAIQLAKNLGCALEVALFLDDRPEAALGALAAQLRNVPVARVIVFHEAEAANETTSPHWIELARQFLASSLPGTKWMGGTNGNFAELNRQRPTIAVMDGVTYTINPQVHAWDERSLVEAIQAQRDTLITARSFCATLPICVTSVTLKPPFNQAATEAEAPQAANVLPASVDPRQMSLFAAGWTVGSLRSLSAGGAHAVTYYETVGWRGLMESEAGNPLPQQFPSAPGMIFPLYYLFAFLAGGKGAKLVEARSPHSIFVEGVGYERANELALAVANLQPHAQAVILGPLPPGEATMQRLNAGTFALAAAGPEEFWAQAESLRLEVGTAKLLLQPYETLFLSIRTPGG
jgi:hypothetical protein